MAAQRYMSRSVPFGHAIFKSICCLSSGHYQCCDAGINKAYVDGVASHKDTRESISGLLLRLIVLTSTLYQTERKNQPQLSWVVIISVIPQVLVPLLQTPFLWMGLQCYMLLFQ
jgi:hypothetical protein